ncbi:hypothetical protein A9G28_00055 [Gilliamella sp. Fer1-1]|jgi:hypothetical protein|uniref:hypothetical protein n=1 Tax=Gilliamella sp. Fer1-1 TaxID=3120240 RepID=UPI00080D8DDF|nr:hypothetical protein [Gilliamella apicola]OCG46339.1 hypothetical protein A9G28_00055 [Gilliamella apicola]
MSENTIFKLDKKYTSFLFKAIEAAKKSEFVIKHKYDIDHFYISFSHHIKINNGARCYTIRFYSEEVTQNNWMDIGSGGIVIDDINVDIDMDSGEVISIYASR